MENLIGKHYGFIFDNLEEEVYIVDSAYKIVYVNKNANINLFNKKDVINKSIFDTFQSLTMENSLIANVFKSGVASINKETTFITNTGKRKEALTSTLPLVEENKIVGVCEISKDITSISNLSEKLMENKINSRKLIKNNKTEKQQKKYYSIDSIIGDSSLIKNLKQQIRTFSKSSSNILIYGETGTGKEMVAQSIHTLSMKDKESPFIAINCAAIPENLLESILFGTVKGAYTGAETKAGLFELAEDGTLFLDEINSMPITLQAKILRALEEGKIRRVGGNKEMSLNFRLISSTNESPDILISKDEFRIDLFYRINVLNIEIPPLRKRREDIPVLIDYFISEFNTRFDKAIINFDDEAMQYFMSNEWVGNVRELKNIIERSFSFAKGDIIKYEDMDFPKYCTVSKNLQKKNSEKNFEHINFEFATDNRIKLNETLDKVEIKIIKRALLKSCGNISKAARELDIPQQTLDNKIKKYNLRSFAKTLR